MRNLFLRIISKLPCHYTIVLSALKLHVHPGLFVNRKPACKPHQHLFSTDCVWEAALPASSLLKFVRG